MLKLTYKDLLDIMLEEFDRFEVISNGIPFSEGDDINDFIEDDGRQYRQCEFKDVETGETYYFNYCWNPHFSVTFPLDLFDTPENVEIIETSVINPPKIVEKEEKVLTQEQIDDKILWEQYLNTDVKTFSNLKDFGLKKKDIQFIFDFLKTKFNMYQLRGTIIPFCIKHKIEEKSFWNYIQKTRK